MEKYKNKYRVQSTRLPYWNYGWNAAYFVTICTAGRICHFGSIENQIMSLSELGRCAERCWLDIPNHFPFVVLHEFVVMPNHVHGILAIDKPVETQNLASLQERQNRFGPQSQNLASIIRGYKIGVSKCAKNQGINFAWQARFHDHVIRSEENYLKIAEYIQTNPQRWLEDTYYV
ncbi:hypothetical protein GO003_007020 [Methylicorpusculum oleiharenae]|uniref:transposase n=1 Tax=Methylicorpusculum oleiharenae TaxID=1338687 RepID=UPI0013570A04|nr:transposase [Methylicorpusculum oleiharenae]MCD2450134.1 hypothetical protein [Methylicorpusculum oleiharenae]